MRRCDKGLIPLASVDAQLSQKSARVFSGEVNMTEFRYYCLHDDGTIAVGANIEAPDLEAAIRSAHEACDAHREGPFRHVEVWRGAEKEYSSLHS